MIERLQNLRALLRAKELESLLITAPSNRRYISVFSGSNGALLVSAEAALIFTDFRYRAQVARQCPSFALHEISTAAPLPMLLAAAAAELGLQQIGVEANHLTVAEHNQIVAALKEQASAGGEPPTLQPVEGIVEELREVKDAAELATLRQAIAITDAAMMAVIPRLRPEQTEKQAAWMFEVAMRERGATGIAFPVIVAAGSNAALPHHQPTDEPLGADRPIVIDMGATLAGYNVDLTRTIVLGEPGERFRAVYELVLAAQQRAIAGLRAGIPAGEADGLARNVIIEGGYGDNFGHGLGHGVGLDIHEGPSLRRAVPGQETATPQLRAGSVFSIEPGIYLEGWGGVRIEDLVLLHENYCEVLSSAPKLRQCVV